MPGPVPSRLRSVWLLSALLGSGCSGPAEIPPAAEAAAVAGTFRFVDVAAESGMTVVTWSGRPDKDHLLDSAGTGAAWLDYDRDGWLDAYVVNAWRMAGAETLERGSNALYRNRGDGTFEEVAERAGVGGAGRWGSGVAVGDHDGDGWPDLLVTTFGANLLYRNRGDGTFEEVAERAGVAAPGWNTGAAFFDADGDGRLDLYIAAYIAEELDAVLAARPSLDWKGVDRVAFGPFGLEGAPDHFFLANGDGTYREATREAGLTDLALGYGFAVRPLDADDDGDLDLYVANDSDANYLYRNDGEAHFTEIGLWSGAAFDSGGAAQAGMGVAVGDADGDGRLDIFVTNFSEDYSTLYLGEGEGFFRDVSESSGVGAATYLALSWGTVLADLDADGDLDLVVANGHIYPQVDRHPEFGMSYEQSDLLLDNRGAGRFVDVSAAAGPAFAMERSSRGLAAGDYDNDGDLDLLITALDRPPALLRNDSHQGNWIGVVCRVAPGAGTVIGARVRVVAGSRSWVRDLSPNGSFLSAHDPRLHIGLGTVEQVERIEIRWPDGTVQRVDQPEINRYVEIEKAVPAVS